MSSAAATAPQDTTDRAFVMADGEVLPGPGYMNEQEINALIRAIVAVTKRDPKLWMLIDRGADPYLTSDGCKLVALAFRVNVDDTSFEAPEHTGEHDENGDEIVAFVCKFRGSRRLADGSIRTYTAIGECSTDLKAIVAQRAIKDKDGKKREPMTRGDARTRAREMAMARAFNRLISGILGIPAITWDDLKDAGITQTNAKQRGGNSSVDPGIRIPTGKNRTASGFVWDCYRNTLVPGVETWKLLGEASKACFGRYWKAAELKTATPEQFAELANTLVQMFGDPSLDPPDDGETSPEAPADKGASTDSGPPVASEQQLAQLAQLAQMLGLDAAAKGALLAACGFKKGQPLTAAIARAAIADMNKRMGGEPPDDQRPLTDDDIPF